MLIFLSAVKLVAEIALLALLGQWVLGLLAGQRRAQNLFYQMPERIARPFDELAGWVTPRVVLERHRPLVAFLILGFVWLAATAAKIAHCLDIGVQLCR
jgi:hypothetical protein